MSQATEMIKNGHTLMAPTPPIAAPVTAESPTTAAPVAAEPTILERRRDAIDQVVGNLSVVMHQIGDLRPQLDELEQLVLSSAARLSAALNDHVSNCSTVRDATAHLADIIAGLRERANVEMAAAATADNSKKREVMDHERKEAGCR